MKRACIVGTGLIGSSIGAALRRAGWAVRGTDKNTEAAQEALRLGHFDQVCPGVGDCALEADAVILAAPVPDIIRLLPEVSRLARAEAVIVDTGSVKVPVAEAMRALPGAERAIGGHPVAGSHLTGPEPADADLFRGRPFVLCPTSLTSPETIDRALALVSDVGAVPSLMAATQHDRALAAVSHLPQVLSSLLALQPAERTLSGTGYRDMTRLAASDPAMWRDILLFNRVNVLESLATFRASLDDLTQTLTLEDADHLERLLARGRDGVAA